MQKNKTGQDGFSRAVKNVVNYKQFGLILAIIAMFVIAAFKTPAMYKADSFIGMFQNITIYGLLAVSAMLVILTGGIDLSVAANLSLSGVIASMFITAFPQVPLIVGVLIGIAVGALGGLVNGLLVGKLRMVPLIATLGTMYIYRGLSFLVSGGVWIFPNKFPNSFLAMTVHKIVGIPGIIWMTAVVFVLAGLFLGYTQPGRRIYAVGTSRESCQVAGISAGNAEVMTYAIAGAIAGFAGVLYASNYAVCYYGIADGYEMTAIAIAVLGGVSIVGGSGRIDGVIIATIFMAIIKYFVSLLPGMTVWQDGISGAIIVVAVVINVLSGRLSIKRMLKERGALI